MLVTSTLENTHCFVAMELLPMQTCSLLHLVLFFGNENGDSWGEFWEYVKKLHPSMDIGDVTIITDQDKGWMNAIADWIPQAGHFHCSHHRRGNIIKNCGGGGGKIKYSALWMYNKLMGCRTVEQIQAAKDT